MTSKHVPSSCFDSVYKQIDRRGRVYIMLIQVATRVESYPHKPHVMAGRIAFALVGEAHQVGALSAQQLGNRMCGKSARLRTRSSRCKCCI